MSSKNIIGPYLENRIRNILFDIGEDPDREGLVDTPARVARFWREFINYDAGNVETAFEAVQSDQMIVVKDIRGWSLCEHHLLPFSFNCSVGYIPHSKIIGLSKIPRVVYKAAHKLQIQERLCEEIANELNNIMHPLGLAVVIKDSMHTCSVMRGVKATGMTMTTSVMRGVFLANPVARSEFFQLINS